MNYIKTYNSFKDESLNEGLGSVVKSAGGALKNFISGIMQPFKNLSKDFKNGLKVEDVKNKISAAVDVVLKDATQSVNNAKDESEITQIKDAFIKQLDAKTAEFDNSIKTIKESRINEGTIQDTYINARVLIDMIKDSFQKRSQEYDKKFAAAKDLATKKQVIIGEFNAAVTEFKKQIQDVNVIRQASDKYKQDNNLKVIQQTIKGTIQLDWNNIQVGVIPIQSGLENKSITEETAKKYPGYYVVVTSTSKKIFPKDIVRIAGTAKKGSTIKMTNLVRNGKPFDQMGEYETGSLSKISNDGKEVNQFEFQGGDSTTTTDTDPVKTVQDKLGEIKGDTEKMKKVSEILPFVLNKLGDNVKMDQLKKLLA